MQRVLTALRARKEQLVQPVPKALLARLARRALKDRKALRARKVCKEQLGQLVQRATQAQLARRSDFWPHDSHCLANAGSAR